VFAIPGMLTFFDAPLDQLWKKGEWSRPDYDHDSNPADGFLNAPPDGPPDDNSRWGGPGPLRFFRRNRPILRKALEIWNAVIGSRWHGKRSEQAKAANPSRNPEYNVANSYFASVSFEKTIGHIWGHRLSGPQLEVIRGQVRGAHGLGLKVRYWDLPHWPIGLRNHVWDTLVREGIDLLNVDDLRAATRWDWRRRRGPAWGT